MAAAMMPLQLEIGVHELQAPHGLAGVDGEGAGSLLALSEGRRALLKRVLEGRPPTL
jgi:hypothetical protein